MMTIEQARKLVADAERDLGTLTRGQISDLLLDNWPYPNGWVPDLAAGELSRANALAEWIVRERQERS